MNILFQDDYFEDEIPIWKKYGATIIHGLCDERDIKEFGPTIARGTISFDRSVKQSFKYKNWPNLMWPFNNDWKVYNYDYLLNCSDILNEDAVIVNMIRYYDIFKSFGEKFWIRSNSGAKLFTGGIFTPDEMEVEFEYFRQKGMGNFELVLANPKEIGIEWRIVIIDGRVIAGSAYMDGGEPKVNDIVPFYVVDFTKEWVKKHKFLFPSSYVVDVCEHDDALKVVEVNNLLTSGWYDCDVEAIVKAIIQQASNP